MRPLRAAAFAVMAPGIAGCALDFDRFQPLAADAGNARADVGSTDDAGLFADATIDDATIDVAMADTFVDMSAEAGDMDGTPVTDAPGPDVACAPAPSCLDATRTCALNCNQQAQQCMSRCSGNNCRAACTRAQTTCVTKCANTCSACAQDAGCASASKCSMVASGP